MVIKTDVEISTNLHVFSTPEYKKIVSGLPSICLYLRMCPSLTPEQLDVSDSYLAF
jgi:hypothetical protein